MPYHITSLTYAVDNWLQAQAARSNTDPTLRIKVSQFVNSDILQGQRLQVIHPEYGVLFACVVNANGRIIKGVDPQLTSAQICHALSTLGFDIIFKTNPQLNAATREFLAAAVVDGYTHVRWADVQNVFHHTSKRVICFNENRRPDLLKQVIKPIVYLEGDIMLVSPNKNPNLDFSWLELPSHIESVLTDNL